MTARTDFNRRVFLASTAGLLTCPATGLLAKSNGRRAVSLSSEHHDAVNRRRRIVVQYDAWSQLGLNFQQWLDYRFNYIDEPGSQIDSVWWDLTALGYATYPSKVLEQIPQAGLDKWREQGIDWVERLVAETKKRKLECFWSHRISEVEMNEEGTGAGWKGKPHPIKHANPDWVIKTWWKQGLWNLAVPGVRALKLRILVDRASLEVFVNDGEASLTSWFLPKNITTSLNLYAKGGTVRIKSLRAAKVRSESSLRTTSFMTTPRERSAI